MPKVLITGASGFVGRNLIKYLESSDFKIEEYSLRNFAPGTELPAVDCIVHLAGKAHDLKKISKPEEYYQTNFELTKQLYNAFLNSSIPRFIFVSSVKAVADSVSRDLSENDSPCPQTHYGKSKRMAEEYIQEQQLKEGQSYYILRPCMIHGPGNKGNLNLLYKFVSRGLPYPLAAYENKRSFLSVENLCFVIKELVERKDIPPDVYNVSDDVALSTSEIVKLLAKSLDTPARLLKVPSSIIKALARIGDIIYLPLNSERLTKLTQSYVVNNSKIKLVLKKDLPLSSRDGILKTALSFKNGWS